MPDLTGMNTAANDVNFQRRVQSALVVAAEAVASEAQNTANHTARSAFATRVLNGQVSGTSFYLAVAAQNLDNTATDAQIQNAVNSIWNALAGGL